MKRTWFTLLLLVLTATHAPAVTYLIQPDGSGDFPTIQEAVDASSDGDSILLADGTYAPIIYPGITTWGKAITICSQSGDPTRCLIDATYSYGFNISQGEGRDTVIEGLTVMNGQGQDGGGFHIKATSPTIRNCIIRDCFSPVSGGGIKAYNGSNPLIEDCHIYGNLAGTTTVGGGGGGGRFQGSPEIRNCLIEDNQISVEGPYLGVGGGISCSPGNGLIVGCTIRENSAYGFGGGLYLSGGTDVVDCTINANEATEKGGGIYYWSSSSNLYSIVDCTIAGNSAPIGSAIMNESSNGGPPGTILLRNSLIAFNEGGQAIDSDAADWPLYISCTDIYGNPGGDWVGHYADQLGQDGNISLDPLFCDLSGGDLHLASQSPCLPAANACDTLMGAWGEGCTLTGLPPEDSAAIQAHLAPNSPNPFNGRTQLCFTLPRPGYVSLRIFDLLGRELAAPIPGRHMGPGEHRLSWDSEQVGGEALPSGIYFARLETPWGTETRKMVLIQ